MTPTPFHSQKPRRNIRRRHLPVSHRLLLAVLPALLLIQGMTFYRVQGLGTWLPKVLDRQDRMEKQILERPQWLDSPGDEFSLPQSDDMTLLTVGVLWKNLD